MKRVHNDPGQPPKSNASGSPPASGPAAKGKKRKAGDTPDAPYTEKSQRRNVSPPALNRQLQEPSLVDRYNEKHQILVETAAKLQDPRNAENMLLLRNANDCIKVMVQTTQRIRSAPSMGQNFTQQSGWMNAIPALNKDFVSTEKATASLKTTPFFISLQVTC
jgi:hypothetical protein